MEVLRLLADRPDRQLLMVAFEQQVEQFAQSFTNNPCVPTAEGGVRFSIGHLWDQRELSNGALDACPFLATLFRAGKSAMKRVPQHEFAQLQRGKLNAHADSEEWVLQQLDNDPEKPLYKMIVRVYGSADTFIFAHKSAYEWVSGQEKIKIGNRSVATSRVQNYITHPGDCVLGKLSELCGKGGKLHGAVAIDGDCNIPSESTLGELNESVADQAERVCLMIELIGDRAECELAAQCMEEVISDSAKDLRRLAGSLPKSINIMSSGRFNTLVAGTRGFVAGVLRPHWPSSGVGARLHWPTSGPGGRSQYPDSGPGGRSHYATSGLGARIQKRLKSGQSQPSPNGYFVDAHARKMRKLCATKGCKSASQKAGFCRPCGHLRGV